MFKLTVLISILVTVSALPEHRLPFEWMHDWIGRIVGGSDAAAGQFPYQCSLRRGQHHTCGGSIITNRWILSAAHCVYNSQPSELSIVTGTHLLLTGGQSYSVLTIRVHENYQMGTLANDVAVLQTTNQIQFNSLTSAIPLATFNLGRVSTTVSGWGFTAQSGQLSNVLQFLQVNTITNEECRNLHTGLNSNLIFDHKICTHSPVGQGTCNGDSGSPLTFNGQVHGIVSWGVACARGFPDVYDRVFVHRTWITQNTN